ncbi:MAG: response regulator transcription factor [Flavobacteriia bacterium]|nr:response regulator transcription factor [Flavobacteriia bacterium]
MKKYNCLIVDDEALARELIQMHLKNTCNIGEIITCSSAFEAAAILKSAKFDLLFLDIQMPKFSGIDFLKTLANPPKVIFTTAYSEYALEGYELHVVDYLLKPITYERFAKAIQKVFEILDMEAQVKEPGTIESKDDSILIKSSHQLIKIKIEDILYIEGLHKYVKIVTQEKSYCTLIGLTSIELEMPSKSFYRCHRSFIVNLNKIGLIEGNQAIIQKFSVPISKKNKEELILKLGKKIG